MASLTEANAKRCSYTLEFKLRVLQWMKDENGSIRGTAKRFGIHRRMVQRWKEKELELTRAFVTNGAHRKKLRLNNQTLFQELEERLMNWFKTWNDSRKTVSDGDIRKQALLIAKDIGLERFKASQTWVVSFKERHGKTNTFNDSSTIRSSLLTHTNPNELINLKLIKGHGSFGDPPSPVPQTQTNHLIYFDYHTPEHNYCKPTDTSSSSMTPSPTHQITPTPVYTIRLSERTYDNTWTPPDIWHDNNIPCDLNDKMISSLSYETKDEEKQATAQELLTHEDSSPLMCNNLLSPFKGTSSPLCMDSIDGVLTIATRTHQPEFTIEPELIYPFGQS